MCLSLPGKITAIRAGNASVDYGEYGVRENVNISLVNVEVGTYVLVHGGFAIRVLSNEEAKETLETWRMVRELQDPVEELQS
jgi:hydrogenase expression/formation protein HypC